MTCRRLELELSSKRAHSESRARLGGQALLLFWVLERASDRAIERAIEGAIERAIEGAIERTIERATERGLLCCW